MMSKPCKLAVGSQPSSPKPLRGSPGSTLSCRGTKRRAECIPVAKQERGFADFLGHDTLPAIPGRSSMPVLGIPLPSSQGSVYGSGLMGKSKELEKIVVFRFDDGRVRAFKEEGTYELARSNGLIFAHETHRIEVPYVEGQMRRKIK